MDKLTKDILSVSKLELSNPEFNEVLMNKIKFQNKKRTLIKNIKFYSLIFISIDVAIIALLNLANIRFSEISFKLTNFNRVFENFHSNIGQLILIYFALLIVVIHVINVISRIGYSKSHLE